MSICFCASGCARNPMADPGVFGDDCSCWCHLWPCGCLKNYAGAHRVGCPDHPEGALG